MKAPAGSIPATDPNFPGYVQEFRNQVEFFKGLARSAWTDSPPGESAQQALNIGRFKEVAGLVDNELDRMTFLDFKTPSPRLDGRLARAALFMYLYDKVLEFHSASLKLNKDGVYAVLDSLREWTYRLLSGNYFTRRAEDIIQDYLKNEAQFVAMAELCQVELVTVQEAAASYQGKVFERLARIARDAGADAPSGKAPGEPAGAGKESGDAAPKKAVKKKEKKS